ASTPTNDLAPIAQRLPGSKHVRSQLRPDRAGHEQELAIRCELRDPIESAAIDQWNRASHTRDIDHEAQAVVIGLFELRMSQVDAIDGRSNSLRERSARWCRQERDDPTWKGVAMLLESVERVKMG